MTAMIERPVDRPQLTAPAIRANAYIVGTEVLVINIDEDDPDLWELDSFRFRRIADTTKMHALIRRTLATRGWTTQHPWATSMDGTVWTPVQGIV